MASASVRLQLVEFASIAIVFAVVLISASKSLEKDTLRPVECPYQLANSSADTNYTHATDPNKIQSIRTRQTPRVDTIDRHVSNRSAQTLSSKSEKRDEHRE